MASFKNIQENVNNPEQYLNNLLVLLRLAYYNRNINYKSVKERIAMKLWKILMGVCLCLALVIAVQQPLQAQAAEETFNKDTFVGLVLQNTEPSTVSVKLYSGFGIDSTKLQTPVFTETVDGVAQDYYLVSAASRYYCVAKPTSGYARYNDQYCIYITEEEAGQKTVMDVTPQKRSTSGWDPSGALLHYTDETMTNIYKSSPDLWPQYAEMFTTPAFQSGRNQHRQTTQTEMMNFINSLDDADDNMHVYIIGKSNGAKASEQFDIPMVLFTTTDLSSATTMEEAAELVKANGKLTVHYQAQIHGDEPAAAEAALGMIKRLDGEYGESLLDSMNIYVIPRLNPWGAYKSNRLSYLNGSTTDPNRDFLHLYTSEVQARMMVYNLFNPEVVFDNHEYQVSNTYNRVKFRDMSLCCHPLFNFTQEYQDTALEIAQAAFSQLEKDDLTYRWYDDSVGGLGGNTGSSNTAFRGSIHILMETDGCDRGLQFYERRVAAHASALGGILAYLDENAQAVKSTVQAQRDLIVENGKTYEEDDVLVFSYKSADREDLHIDGHYILLDSGTIEDKISSFPASYPSIITRSRVAPTAYVIPAGESYTETVLALMDKQGISYDFLAAGSEIFLQQYTLISLNEEDGMIAEAGLTEEKVVAFPNGAYAFTMDQEDALILACLMEPDMNIVRSQKGTLVHQEIIAETDGYYPIYRYIRDLNAKGEVDLASDAPAAPNGLSVQGAAALDGLGKIVGLDAAKKYEYRLESGTAYTAVPAGATEIQLAPGKYAVRFATDGNTPASLDVLLTVGYENLTECVVYLDGVNGDDTRDGYTEATAVKTIQAAFTQLDFMMEFGNENTICKIVITADVTVTTRNYTMPAHDYPVVICSKTGNEGIIYNSTDTSARRYFAMGGDTTFENMTLTLKTRYTDNYLVAGSYKLVVESTVKTVANQDGHFFNVIAGRHAATGASTDVTIKAGTWRNIYAGGYTQSINGDAKIRLSDCTVTMLTNSYNCATRGDVYWELKNVTVKNEIFCGNANKANVEGNVEIILGEGVTFGSFYAGSRDAGNINGTVTVTVDGADLTGLHLNGKAKSETGTNGGSYLVYKSGTLGTYSDFTEFVDKSDEEPPAPEVVKGDMDGDGMVSDADAMYLLRYTLFGESRYPLNQGGDVDGSGNISDADAMYLLRYTLFGDSRYPLH